MNAGHDRCGDPGIGTAASRNRIEGLVLEEKLGDRARQRPASILRFRYSTSALHVSAPRGAFPDRPRPRSRSPPIAGQRRDQLNRAREPLRDAARTASASAGGSPRSATIRRQPSLAIGRVPRPSTSSRGSTDTGQVPGHVQPCALADCLDCSKRAITGRPAGAICHRHKFRGPGAPAAATAVHSAKARLGSSSAGRTQN